MRYQGTIKKWNDERGFGFIRETQSTAEIFAHIFAFHNKMPRPQVGETVSFDIADNAKGKKEARNIHYLNRPQTTKSKPSTRHHPQPAPRTTSPLLSNLIALILIAIAGYLIYRYFLVDFFRK